MRLLRRHPPPHRFRGAAEGPATARGGLALGAPAPLLDRVEAREPLVAALAFPLELGLAVGVALGDAPAAAPGGDRVQRGDRMAQLFVGAALAPVPLADGVRHRAPAVPLRALPFHQAEAVDVGLGEAAAAAPRGI